MARNHPEIYFASMHPGWADTPAVRASMPDFYEKMKVVVTHVFNCRCTPVCKRCIIKQMPLQNLTRLFIMQEKLRTAEQGADTLVWLAVSTAAKEHASGLFFQDRVPVSTHLPLAWTHTSDTENAEFMLRLTALTTRFQPN